MSKKRDNMLLGFSISIFINIVFLITIVLISTNNKKDQKDNFCTCSGLQKKICNDPNEMSRLYREGKLTEYNFPMVKKQNDPLLYSSRQCNNN